MKLLQEGSRKLLQVESQKLVVSFFRKLQSSFPKPNIGNPYKGLTKRLEVPKDALEKKRSFNRSKQLLIESLSVLVG